jgi:hypothetical protein
MSPAITVNEAAERLDLDGHLEPGLRSRDGSTISMITVTLTDAFGNPVAGKKTVSLAQTARRSPPRRPVERRYRHLHGQNTTADRHSPATATIDSSRSPRRPSRCAGQPRPS